MHHDEFVFVQSIRKRFWLGMLASIDAALLAAARRPLGERRGASGQPGADVEFMGFLVAAREYLLGEGRRRPVKIDDERFLLLKPLCESLVEQGRFPHETLQLFTEIERWSAGSRPDAPAPGATEPR